MSGRTKEKADEAGEGHAAKRKAKSGKGECEAKAYNAYLYCAQLKHVLCDKHGNCIVIIFSPHLRPRAATAGCTSFNAPGERLNNAVDFALNGGKCPNNGFGPPAIFLATDANAPEATVPAALEEFSLLLLLLLLLGLPVGEASGCGAGFFASPLPPTPAALAARCFS